VGKGARASVAGAEATAPSPIIHGPEALAERLRERRGEIEEAILARIRAIADPKDAADPSYVEGLWGALSAAVDYGIAATEGGGEPEPQLPLALTAQARRAARNGVSLDTVLRRYIAGYSVLGYFIMEEASRDGLMGGSELQRLVGTQTAVFDRLLAAIGEEHTRESESLRLTSEQRRAEWMERLLGGELLDTSGLAYDFEGWHLGLLAAGSEVEGPLRDLARALDLRPLLVRRGDRRTVWAWLGGPQRFDPAVAHDSARRSWPAGALLAIGEPGEGLSGWRLTHRQAAAALPIAQRGAESVVRYADVALLASALQDDLLATSLRELLLSPLKRERDGGTTTIATLRAYLAAGCNASSTAASLGVTRQTVSARLKAVEDLLGRSIEECRSELDIALRLDDPDSANRV